MRAVIMPNPATYRAAYGSERGRKGKRGNGEGK